jgi:citrate synthase
VAVTAEAAPAVAKGLESVVAASTRLSFIDGKAGVLVYAGYDIHELAGKASFEEVCHLLWDCTLPTWAELDGLEAKLAAERSLGALTARVVREIAGRATPMDALRTAASAMAHEDPDLADMSPDANRRKAIRLTAKFATAVAAYHRLRRGLEPVEPDPALGHAANFLWMLNGKAPTDLAARAMDIALVLHAEHGLNASTFAARVVVATLADMHAGVVAGVCGLKGPLHGGANERVMEMIDEIRGRGGAAAAEAYVKEKLARKERIMGCGHRVYRTEDPRATHLRRLSKDLCTEAGLSDLYEISRIVEETAKREKNLNPNVDFYSATTYHALGIPTDLFTPIFAVSRVAGWSAHVMEQLGDNRLIRPQAAYGGPRDLKFVPIDRR